MPVEFTSLNLLILIRQILKEIRMLNSSMKHLMEKYDELHRSLVTIAVPDDQLLNVARAAEVLGVSTKTVERYRQNGILSFKKPMGLVYYSRNEVMELARNIKNKKEPGAV